MQYKEILNRLIAADDLHYNERERRYVSLSESEVEEISSKCSEHGITDPSQIHAVVQWCGNVRIGQLLFGYFMSGRLRLTGLHNSEPSFGPMPIDETP